MELIIFKARKTEGIPTSPMEPREQLVWHLCPSSPLIWKSSSKEDGKIDPEKTVQ